MITGYNLMTYRARWLRLIEPGRAYLYGPSAANYDADFLASINEAQDWITDRIGMLRERDATTDVVASTRDYAVPDGLFGGRIESVERLDDNGDWQRLDLVAWTEIADGNEDAGTPVKWAPDPTNLRQIRLYPVPDTAQTNGLRFLFNPAPTRLERLYEPSVTASVTNGATAVTLSGSPDTTLFQANDEFGLLPTTQSDGSTVSGVPPRRWYQIESVTDTAVVLSEAYTGATASGQSWVSGQVPDFERLYPGKLRAALVYLAASISLETTDPNLADRWRMRAYSELAEFRRDDMDAAPAGKRQAHYCPGGFEDY